MRWFSALLLVIPVVILGGCTYANVPAQSGDIARNNPNEKEITPVVLEALRYAVADRPPTGQFQVVLPTGTVAPVYEELLPKIAPNAVWGLEPREGLEVLDARVVRIRGWHAQVDIVRPIVQAQPAGPGQLVTVYLDFDPFTKWRASDMRIWRIPLDQALIQSAQEFNRPLAP